MSLRPNDGASSTSHRKKVYKNTGVDFQEGRRRRQDGAIQIRKNRRQENLSKKRKEEEVEDDASSPCPINPNPDLVLFKIQRIPTLTRQLFSNDLAAQLEATTQICTLLSKGHIALIDEVIRAGVVPQLVKFLARVDAPQLQSKAASTLSYISSGTSEHTRIVVEHEAVPLLVRLLYCGTDDTKEEAIWALGNIAGDSPSTRDHVVGYGALFPILGLLWNPLVVKRSTLRIASWTLANLCRGKPSSTVLEQMRSAIPFLRNLLVLVDEEIVVNACWTLAYLTHEASSEMIQAVIDANICPRLVVLLSSPVSKATVPIMVTLGSLAMGDEANTQVLIDSGALPCLKLLLSQSDKDVVKHACWVISNITAGNIAQIQAVIDADLISPLVHLSKAEFDIKKEVAWVIANATYGTPEQIRFLASKGCIEALCDILICSDTTMMAFILLGLYTILLVDEGNVYAEKVEACGGLEKILSLQGHENDDVYTMAVDILETYWPDVL
ncbi:importin subunit alpha-4-like [Cicer arietinum]|uniref:Importin subunit alpha n=1 Tax=Cicer arietinum TaxID=3827 RepID=A0A1S2XU46_CICAR|nr:importin subunit alpha-4-like [Cicer arietinum]